MKKQVYIAYTGGTIGMRKTSQGYAPASGYLQEHIAGMPEMHSELMPDYTIQEYDPLLDSSDMTPQEWLLIARDIAANYEHYDGFIILHGTDTMAYTASALPFMLEGLQKPVIITGSQIPLCELRNDARENLITVMELAANYAIPEVCLYFGHQLLRGCRSVKVNADGFDAFASPNFPALGSVGIDIQIHWERVLPTLDVKPPLEVRELAPSRVAALRLFPGINPAVVHNILQPPLQGLVLETYGVGNGPSHPDFLAALKEGADRGVVIVDCTQCLRGSVNLGDYATGAALARAGVISGCDMTAEAALAKLFYLFSQNLSVDTVKTLMQTNLRGELTPPRE